jgi:hypothetical protein
MTTELTVLDPEQLRRIEAVHKGFLYQHLYAASCMLLAGMAGASAIIVEADEDIEIVFPERRLYVQVKTRSLALTKGDIGGALERFAKLRTEHVTGRRTGAAEFIVGANVAPGPGLAAALSAADWPVDVRIEWPDSQAPASPLPKPWRSIPEGLGFCAALAAALPLGMLVPETLVWKLAGVVMSAAAGLPPYSDHRFKADDLPDLFEQLTVHLQDFPSPPPVYRSQEQEPELIKPDRVRMVTGFSGAGKTIWVAQAAQHSTAALAYFDVGDTPGPALALPLARELAGRFFGKSGGLGRILLPGATGAEMLRALGLRLEQERIEATIVIDNAHRVPAENLRAVVEQTPHARFILLAQPGATAQELQAILSVASEPLGGWSTDTIAAEASDNGCRANYAACERLRRLTAGLPLYVQNAIQIARTEYAGEVARFCDELEARTHQVETAQNIILTRVFDGLSPQNRDAVACLSLSDVPLERDEAAAFLAKAINLDERGFATLIRALRPTGIVEIFGGDRLKIHDALRGLGLALLDAFDKDQREAIQTALKDILLVSILRQKDLAKFSLYMRLLAELGDLKTLVEFATDELFHEMGVIEQVSGMLAKAASSESFAPAERFSAYDGLAFGAFKHGDLAAVEAHLASMSQLIESHKLDDTDKLTHAMKAMNLAARKGDRAEVFAQLDRVSELVPEKPAHLRIFRYNAAHALLDLSDYDACVSITEELIPEYYDDLGITPADIMGKNPDKIWPLLKEGIDHGDDLKHLADCLDLQAIALNKAGHISPLARIHAMKFYDMSNALDSFIRVGQDFVDELVGRNDYVGARDVFERNLIPVVTRNRMVSRIVTVRSHYAVVLAYCGEHDLAAAEMAKLSPYMAGLPPERQQELANQQRLIARLRREAPPPQWEFPAPRRKIGRNERCYCGSGKKYKYCHGR